MVTFPKKKKREVKPFKYPHKFQVGDLVAFKKATPVDRKKYAEFATIVSIETIDYVEKITLYFQDGVTKTWDLPAIIFHLEKV